MKQKKILPGLRIPIHLIAICILITQSCLAQDCKIKAANKPSVLVRGTDDYFDFSHYTQKPAKWVVSKMKLQTGKAERWIKNRLTGVAGARMLYYNSYWLDYVVSEGGTGNDVNFYRATGIKRYYSSKTMFFAYYCYDNNNNIQTEDESGSNVDVVFNNFFVTGLTMDAGVFNIDGKPVFSILKMKRSEGRTDFYEQRVRNNATGEMYTTNDYILLRNSDKPVFIPVTRKQYLGQMLKNIEAYSINETRQQTQIYEQNRKQFEEEMKSYKAMDKSYTPEKEAKRRKWFEEDQEKLKKGISKINPDTEAAGEVIKQYLKKPDEWLNRHFSHFYPFSSFTAGGVKQYLEGLDKSALKEGEEDTLYEIVSVNPAYFDKKTGSDTPQLIALHLQNGTYAHMLKVANLIKQPGALAPLEAILNPVK